MFAVIISPFWLAISVIYFGLGVFHWRLSKRISVDIEFPAKDAIFGIGSLAKFNENEYRKTAYLNKQTLKFAAAGFLVAFVISFFQSISINYGQIALDSASLVAVFAIGVILALIVVLFVVLRVDSLINHRFTEITLPWMWYDEKKGVTYDLVSDFAAYLDEKLVLLAAAHFKVPPGLKKSPDKLKEGVTIQEVSGELTVKDVSAVDAVRRTYESQRSGGPHDIRLKGFFKDRDMRKRAAWELYDMTFTSEEPSETFSFSASARLLFTA